MLKGTVSITVRDDNCRFREEEAQMKCGFVGSELDGSFETCSAYIPVCTVIVDPDVAMYAGHVYVCIHAVTSEIVLGVMSGVENSHQLRTLW